MNKDIREVQEVALEYKSGFSSADIITATIGPDGLSGSFEIFRDEASAILLMGKIEEVIERYCVSDDEPSAGLELLCAAAQVPEAEWEQSELRRPTLEIVQHMVSELNPLLHKLRDYVVVVGKEEEQMDRFYKALSARPVEGKNVQTVLGVLMEIGKRDPDCAPLTVEVPETHVRLIVEAPFVPATFDYWVEQLQIDKIVRKEQATIHVSELVQLKNRSLVIELDALAESAEGNNEELLDALGIVAEWIEERNTTVEAVNPEQRSEFHAAMNVNVLEMPDAKEFVAACLRIAEVEPLLWMRMLGHDLRYDHGTSGENTTRRSSIFGNSIHAAIAHTLQAEAKTPEQEVLRTVLQKVTVLAGDGLPEQVHMNRAATRLLEEGIPQMLRMPERDEITGADMAIAAATTLPFLRHMAQARVAAVLEAPEQADIRMERICAYTNEMVRENNIAGLHLLLLNNNIPAGIFRKETVSDADLQNPRIRYAVAYFVSTADIRTFVQLKPEVFALFPEHEGNPVHDAFVRRLRQAPPSACIELLEYAASLDVYKKHVYDGSDLSRAMQSRLTFTLDAVLPAAAEEPGLPRMRRVFRETFKARRMKGLTRDVVDGLDDSIIDSLLRLELWRTIEDKERLRQNPDLLIEFLQDLEAWTQIGKTKHLIGQTMEASMSNTLSSFQFSYEEWVDVFQYATRVKEKGYKEEGYVADKKAWKALPEPRQIFHDVYRSVSPIAIASSSTMFFAMCKQMHEDRLSAVTLEQFTRGKEPAAKEKKAYEAAKTEAGKYLREMLFSKFSEEANFLERVLEESVDPRRLAEIVKSVDQKRSLMQLFFDIIPVTPNTEETQHMMALRLFFRAVSPKKAIRIVGQFNVHDRRQFFHWSLVQSQLVGYSEEEKEQLQKVIEAE